MSTYRSNGVASCISTSLFTRTRLGHRIEAVGVDATLSRVIRAPHRASSNPIAPRSPRQNSYAERFVSTLRHEFLDQLIALGEHHLLRLVRQHARYYKEDRPHMSLRGDASAPRIVGGRVVALPRVAGLHHRYSRVE